MKILSISIFFAIAVSACMPMQQPANGSAKQNRVPKQPRAYPPDNTAPQQANTEPQVANAAMPPKINTGTTQFGALIKPPGQQGSTEFKLNVARKLGITCLREGVTLKNPADKPIFNSGFDIVLNVNSDVSIGFKQTPFPTDLTTYKQQLQTQLSMLKKKPLLLVIENEENDETYHSGSAQDYLNELQAAVTVAHANGLEVTNGGITFPAIQYLVYLDYLQQGKRSEANDLQQRGNIQINVPRLTKQKEFLQQLIAGYAKIDIDYVNFHWYGINGDTKSLVEVVNYLQRVTGKRAISNEIGQHDASKETVAAIIKTCRQLSLRYAIWYSGDGGTEAQRNNGEKAIALQNDDGSLRDGGEVFKTESK